MQRIRRGSRFMISSSPRMRHSRKPVLAFVHPDVAQIIVDLADGNPFALAQGRNDASGIVVDVCPALASLLPEENQELVVPDLSRFRVEKPNGPPPGGGAPVSPGKTPAVRVRGGPPQPNKFPR